jgi:mono/diheme cytochrome c family protein
MTSSGKGKSLAGLVILALGLAACSRRPLPEAGSAAVAVYAERCGGCHRAFDPASMKYALWEMLLPRMEERMRSAGMPPLSGEERDTIRAYLRRNSG